MTAENRNADKKGCGNVIDAAARLLRLKPQNSLESTLPEIEISMETTAIEDMVWTVFQLKSQMDGDIKGQVDDKYYCITFSPNTNNQILEIRIGDKRSVDGKYIDQFVNCEHIIQISLDRIGDLHFAQQCAVNAQLVRPNGKDEYMSKGKLVTKGKGLIVDRGLPYSISGYSDEEQLLNEEERDRLVQDIFHPALDVLIQITDDAERNNSKLDQ